MSGCLVVSPNLRVRKQIRKLEARITKMAFMDSNLKDQLIFCGQLLPNLSKHYTTVDFSVKQQIIGAIYPEKLVFENNSYRTARVNYVIRWICRLVKGYKGYKNKEGSDKSEPSSLVGPAGQLSNLLIEDLIKIDTFYTNYGQFIQK